MEKIDSVKTKEISKGIKKNRKKLALITLIAIALVVTAFMIPSFIDAEAIIQQSQELLKEGNYEEAKEQLLKINTEEAQTLLEQIDIYKAINSGDFDKALEMFEQMGDTQINYDTGGGELLTEDLIDYVFNSYATCEKNGYNFEGWEVSDYDMDLSNLNVNLDAIYSLSEYMIDLELDGGKIDQLLPNKYTIESEDIVIPNPEKAGYEFLGWTALGALGATGLLKDYVIEENSTGDLNLVANWQPIQYNIVFDSNGGKPVSTMTCYTGSYIKLPTAERQGYQFDGWYNGQEKMPESFLWNYTENLNLKAKWVEQKYNITYNCNMSGVYVNPNIQTVQLGEYVSLPKIQKEGYEFLGWYYNNQKISDGKWTINTDCVLQARWQLIGHTHMYSSKIVQPTCTEQGYTTYTCSCGDYYISNYVDTANHIYNEWEIIQEATETMTGLKERKCKNCTHIETEVIPVLSHTHKYSEQVTKPTCTEPGYTIYTCACSYSYKEANITPKGHTYKLEEIVKPATGSSSGIGRYICVDCGEQIHKYID